MLRAPFRLFLIVACFGVAAFLAGGCGEPAPRPNIVLVVLDTVREDVAARDPAARPVLAALAAESTVFTNAWATAPWTVPSHASMFTGLLAAGHHCTHQNPRLDADKTTLAELLGQAGYATAAFYSNPWLSDRTTGLLRGFATVQEAPVQGGVAGDAGTWRGDQGGRASVGWFRRWLRSRGPEQPFFAFVNLLEAHLPYDPPADVRRHLLPQRDPDDLVTGEWGMEYQAGLHAFGEVDWARHRDLYWGDVATVDGLLGGIVAALTEAGHVEDTVLIVCSDHGENLGDHGLVDHQFSLHESLLAVPLIVRAPGLLAAGERTEPVLLSDIFATVGDLAGFTAPVPTPHSRSLLGGPAPAGRALVAEYARPQGHLVGSLARLNPDLDRGAIDRALRSIRVGDVRLTLADDGEVQLHDLAADPGQEHNVFAERPGDVKALRALLEQELAAYRPGGRSEVELDEATREKLRSLGYVR
ncbi:sulfatase [bacterium]|nr:sulfatase [bacterium]